MSRIEGRFRRLREQGRKALIPFLTAGDPEPGMTVALMHAMVEAGADIIELGVPFSDPMAEGPVIQRACERALRHHVGLADVFAMVREFREADSETPIVLMGYLNPLEIMGYERFARSAAEAGADGVITVDLPPEEGDDYVTALRSAGLDPIFLLAPTSPDERVERVAASASGFIYYVSLKGVTGAGHLDVDAVARRLDQIRGHCALPLTVGFGIRDAESAARLSRLADGVVVGSRLVQIVADREAQPDEIGPEIGRVLREMRGAMDAGAK